ncbi:MAG: hypothetical protein IJB32_04415 [Clostridia bacterium]|nr:hypothetical protein [Clostridia bacterium]
MEGKEFFSYPCSSKEKCNHYKPNGKYVELAKEHCVNCPNHYVSEIPYEFLEGMKNKEVYK